MRACGAVEACVTSAAECSDSFWLHLPGSAPALMMVMGRHLLLSLLCHFHGRPQGHPLEDLQCPSAEPRDELAVQIRVNNSDPEMGVPPDDELHHQMFFDHVANMSEAVQGTADIGNAMTPTHNDSLTDDEAQGAQTYAMPRYQMHLHVETSADEGADARREQLHPFFIDTPPGRGHSPASSSTYRSTRSMATGCAAPTPAPWTLATLREHVHTFLRHLDMQGRELEAQMIAQELQR